jgi:hypothetical protein
MDVAKWHFWLCQFGKLDCRLDASTNRELPNEIVPFLPGNMGLTCFSEATHWLSISLLFGSLETYSHSLGGFSVVCVSLTVERYGVDFSRQSVLSPDISSLPTPRSFSKFSIFADIPRFEGRLFALLVQARNLVLFYLVERLLSNHLHQPESE